MSNFDAIIVGYGPVGQTLALMLARQGRKVAVVERWKERYPLPRAVGMDHEIFRMLSGLGLHDRLNEITVHYPHYEWFNAQWEPLITLPFGAVPVSGGHEMCLFCQPELERSLDAAVAATGSVEHFFGWEVQQITQNSDSASLVAREAGGSGELRLSGKFIVGCDGANSVVRPAIGEMEDFGFQEDWLVVDAKVKEGLSLDDLNIPALGQYCDPKRPTTIVPGGLDGGVLMRRWEFMLLPGETVEEMENQEKVWSLLKPWVGPDQIVLVRHRAYTFRSLLAKQWHDGRVLIAGDAAHQMPPFFGQGLNSGLRDAWSLAWRLGLIFDGKADLRLLESYQPERSPHVHELIHMSIFLGQVICISDPEEAAKRDAAFAAGEVPPFPAFPAPVAGLFRHVADGALQPGAGNLAPHVDVDVVGVRKRMDDHFGPGFLLVIAEDCAERPDNSQARAFAAVGGQVWPLGGADAPKDMEGRMATFLAERGWKAMIVRPDYYAYGGAESDEDLNSLLDVLSLDLTAAGVAI